MTQKAFTEAKKIRPALVDIDRILGNSVSPAKKMEMFDYVQNVAANTIRRVLHDMGMLSVRKPRLTKKAG
jgi:hypothetical protein